MPRPWNLVIVFRLVLLTELWVLSSPQMDRQFLWGLRWLLDGLLYFFLLCLQAPGWLPSAFFFFSDLLNLQIWKGNPKVVIWHHLLQDHCKLAVCMWLLGKTLRFLRGIFCAPSAAPIGPCFLISFSLGWKKGLLWEWCPTTEATVSSEDFEKCLLSNFTIAGKWRSLDSAIWKEYGCVSKKEHPKWKKYVHIGKLYVNAKLLSSVTDYRKFLMFGVG